ncbi:uncharacterized protein BDZ99DRAFT_386857, partial [Mytilinidion resinicola]
QRPLLFICHSLGGLVVKRALSSAYQYQRIYEDVTAGIIFLGTPHLAAERDEKWNLFKLIMRANRKDIAKENMTQDEIASIATVCRRFAALPLNIPILSVYEDKESKVRENLLQAWRSSSKTSIRLVPESLAATNHRNESLFKVDSNHWELCHLEVDGPLFERLAKYFRAFSENAPANVAVAFRYSFQPDKLPPKQSTELRQSSAVEHTPGSASSTDQTTVGREESDINREDHVQVKTGVQLPFSHVAAITRNPEFFGREEVLVEIDRHLLSDVNGKSGVDSKNGPLATPKSFVMSGMGGMGKTEIAIEYTFSRRQNFDAVFWVTADTTRKLADQFLAIAKELGLDRDGDNKLDEIAAREKVKAWLADPTGYYPREDSFKDAPISWFFVLDNADDPDVLYDWIPTHGPGSVLVTSRYPYLKESSYSLNKGLELVSLDVGIAAAMLRKLSKRETVIDTNAASNRIAELLGGLPLAISQMSAVIRRKHLSLLEFEQYYPDNSKNLHSTRINGAMGNYQHTVWTTWAVEQLSPATLALLNILSVLDPDCIPEKVLTKSAKDVSLKDYPSTKGKYFEARAELIHSSLVVRNMATNELRIHRLVQDVVKQRLSQDQLHDMFANAAILLSGVWPYRYRVGERYTAHISRLESLFGPEIREKKYDGTPTSGKLFSSYAWYSYELGLFRLSINFASLARLILSVAKDSNTGSEREVTAWLCDAYAILSVACTMTNTSDSMSEARAWIALLLERIEKWHLPYDAGVLASAYNQVAVSHMKRGETEEAIGSWRQSFEAFKNQEDKPQFSETWPAVNVALVSVFVGRVDEAVEILTPVMEEHENVFGKEDKTTIESGEIWRAMGNIKFSQAQYNDALEYHKLAVTNLKAVLGNKHKFTADAVYALAKDYIVHDEKAKAAAALEDAISAYINITYQKPQIARVFWKKGVLMKGSGNNLEGDTLLEKAMQLRKEFAPEDRRPVEELADKDWDELVFYWSR